MALTKRGTTPDFTQSQYDFEYRVFPENLGDEENSHYMIININMAVSVSGTSLVPRTNLDGVSFTSDRDMSKLDTLRTSEVRSGNFNQGGGSIFVRNPTRRIASSIALHMPNGGLVFTDDNKYEEVSMTSFAGSIISATARAVGGELAGKAADLALGGIGGLLKNGARIAASPINPMVEVLFATKPQRQWMFEVLLVPRTQRESDTIKEIIYTLRYFSAPELFNFGTTFMPPAEFDITFFRNGQENLNLPRINTCVLEKIDVDYAPADGKFSTFKNGAPVATRLSLGFRELEIAHRARISQGF